MHNVYRRIHQPIMFDFFDHQPIAFGSSVGRILGYAAMLHIMRITLLTENTR